MKRYLEMQSLDYMCPAYVDFRKQIEHVIEPMNVAWLARHVLSVIDIYCDFQVLLKMFQVKSKFKGIHCLFQKKNYQWFVIDVNAVRFMSVLKSKHPLVSFCARASINNYSPK